MSAEYPKSILDFLLLGRHNEGAALKLLQRGRAFISTVPLSAKEESIDGGGGGTFFGL